MKRKAPSVKMHDARIRKEPATEGVFTDPLLGYCCAFVLGLVLGLLIARLV